MQSETCETLGYASMVHVMVLLKRKGESAIYHLDFYHTYGAISSHRWFRVSIGRSTCNTKESFCKTHQGNDR